MNERRDQGKYIEELVRILGLTCAHDEGYYVQPDGTIRYNRTDRRGNQVDHSLTVPEAEAKLTYCETKIRGFLLLIENYRKDWGDDK